MYLLHGVQLTRDNMCKAACLEHGMYVQCEVYFSVGFFSFSSQATPIAK